MFKDARNREHTRFIAENFDQHLQLKGELKKIIGISVKR